MGRLRAAAGQVDLKPPVGGWMTGFAARVEPTTGVHDPIMARAVYLDDGRTPLAIVTCDLIGFTAEAVAEMRRQIAGHGALPASNILLACTHTHSGPATMPFRGPAMGHVDAGWLAQAQNQIVDLVASLPRRVQPARWSHGTAAAPGIGYNRQDPTRPIDEELSAIAVESTNGSGIATLLNFSTHAVVMGPDNLGYSGDYPGEAMRQIAARRGGVGLFLLGACGDADPQVYRDRGWGTGTFDDTHTIGRQLADAASGALAHAPRTAEARIRVASKTIDIPLAPPPAQEQLDGVVAGLESDRQTALAAGDRMNEWVALAMLDWARDLGQAMRAGSVPRTLPVELFVAAIDEVRIIAVPLEPYSDISLRIKQELKPVHTLFAGYANGLFGYCPTAWAKAQGGYGPDSSARWFPQLLTPIDYGADDVVVEESVKLAQV